MCGIVVDEVAGESGDIFDAGGATLQFQAALDQLAGARANHIARRGERDRGKTFAIENKIQRVDQIGRGVHERTVEIEHNDAG